MNYDRPRHSPPRISGWAFLEQLALAAIDVGRLDIADVSEQSGVLEFTV